MAVDREGLDELYKSLLYQYKDFFLSSKPFDHKSFVEHQNACKAALTHLILLEKFINQGSSLDENYYINEMKNIESLINESREALKADYQDDI